MAERDADRERVYRAEDTAFAHTRYEQAMPWAAVRSAAQSIVDDPWWRAVMPGCRPQVVKTRADAARSAAVAGLGMARVRVAPGHGTWITLSHEHAHLLARAHDPMSAGHGPVFRAAHLAVAQRVLGATGAGMLRRGYELHGLHVGEPAWKVPEPHPLPHGIAELHAIVTATA